MFALWWWKCCTATNYHSFKTGKTGFEQCCASTLFIVVNNIVYHCYTWFRLNNIVQYCRHCSMGSFAKYVTLFSPIVYTLYSSVTLCDIWCYALCKTTVGVSPPCDDVWHIINNPLPLQASRILWFCFYQSWTSYNFLPWTIWYWQLYKLFACTNRFTHRHGQQ